MCDQGGRSEKEQADWFINTRVKKWYKEETILPVLNFHIDQMGAIARSDYAVERVYKKNPNNTKKKLFVGYKIVKK